MPDAKQLSKDIRDRLQVVDPELSTALGTPTRKIIDAVAAAAADISFSNSYEDYRFDLNAYSGADLDEFVGLFGFQRQRATAATGTVTVERDNADAAIAIATNAQFYKPATSSTPAIFFAASGYVTMDIGQATADIPIRALTEGSDGNVAANTITGFDGNVIVSRSYNALPTTGGVDAETDDQLRSRFKMTVFRNVAGTKDQYMGLALAHALVTRADVIGQVSLWSEIVTMVDILGIAQADSTNDELRLLWDADQGVWLYDIEGVDHGGTPGFYVAGVSADYTVSEAGGVVTFEEVAGQITDDTVCRMEYEFLSVVNRNNATDDMPRAVEVIVDGEDSVTVIAEMLLEKSLVFDDAGGELDKDNWVRLDDTTSATATNVFVPLPFQPILGLPDSIDFGAGVTVDEDAGFFFVRDITAWRGSYRGRDGIEFVVGANAPNGVDDIADGAPFTIIYQYNRVPKAIQDLIERYRQVPADALVHAAKRRYFSPQLVVMYSVFPTATVDVLIEDALEEYFNTLPLGAWIQLADIEHAVHNVGGVDSVKFDAGGLIEYATDGTTEVVASPYTNDVKLRSDEIGVFHSVVITNRTQEQWV